MALLLAAAHPGLELVGVSVVGEDPPAQAALATLLLEWAGASDVPVVMPVGAAGAVETAVPDVIVAIGPLGNVARILPGADCGPSVVLMGGLLRPVRHRGAERDVESNFGADPAAAGATLARAVRCVVVPLDATVVTGLDRPGREALVVAAPPLAPLFGAWLDRLGADGVPEGEATVHLHDPVAVLVAAGDHGEIGARFQRLALAVTPDGHVVEDPTGAVCDVMVALDGPSVARRTLQILGGAKRITGP